MPEERELEKQLKIAAKTGKYVVGRREVASGLKGSKLLVWSASANVPQRILDESRSLGVPSVRFDGNPVELGRVCGIPFRVSVMAVKLPGDADLQPFASSADYVALVPSVPQQAIPKVAEETKAEKKPEEEVAPAKKARAARKPKKQAKPEEAEEKEAPEAEEAKPKAKTAKKSAKKEAKAAKKESEERE